MFEIDSSHLTLFALVLVILMLLRTTVLRFRKNAQKKQQYDHSLWLAKEAERQQRLQTAVPKSKIITTQSRIPTADPFAQPFTGSIQGFAAKWEAEIHQLGRQIIGQIDSKMAALQAISLDANRTANRLEILVEHLEAIARQQMEGTRQQVEGEECLEENLQASHESNILHEPDRIEKGEAEKDQAAKENAPPQTTPLTHVLNELSEDMENIRKTVKRGKSPAFQESVEPAVVVRLAEGQSRQANSPQADSRQTNFRQTGSLPAPPSSSLSMPAADIRNEVEMLLNYGIEPEEIARRLNISLGEVDLIMQIQTYRTM